MATAFTTPNPISVRNLELLAASSDLPITAWYMAETGEGLRLASPAISCACFQCDPDFSM